jgi:predicted Zn-dependent peptidase
MRRGICRIAILAGIAAAVVAAPAIAQVKDHTKIKFPQLPEFNVAKPEIYELDNGMKVFLMENHELPLISVNAMIRTGSNFDPDDRTGLADLFGQVHRDGGTQSMTGDDMDDFLAARAAFIETGMGGDSGSASMNCLKEDFDEVFALFAELLRSPSLAEDKLELAKVQANTAIARRNDDQGAITGREFRRLIYGADSPLGRMMEYATVDAITRDDLVAWHGKYYHPNNVLIGFTGDFDTETMKGKIQAMLGDWEKGPAFSEPDAAFREEPDKGIYFVEKSDVTQSDIRMGHLGITRQNPDYFAVRVMNEVLGGGFASRLFSNVRSEKGLAYSVFGGVGAGYLRPGVFQVGLQTASENTTKAIAALREEVDGIIANPPTAEEMARAKDVISNSFIFNYTSRGQILAQQMTYAYYGMPLDYLDTYLDNIEKVTSEDVARVAKKYVHPDDMTLLVVGKKADILEPLDTLGSVAELDITIPPPADTAPEVVKNAETVAAGAAIFERMAGSAGGTDPGGLAGYHMEGTMEVQTPQGAMGIGLDLLVSFPDRMRMKLQTPMGEQLVVVDGETGFAGMGGQFQDLPGPAVEDQKENLYRDPYFLAKHRDDPDLETVAAGTDDVDGVACDVVAVTFRGTSTRMCVADDGRVLKMTYQGDHPFNRAPGTIEATLGDFRDIDGRQVAHEEAQTFNGEPLMTLQWKSFRFNPEVDDSTFAKPQ